MDRPSPKASFALESKTGDSSHHELYHSEEAELLMPMPSVFEEG